MSDGDWSGMDVRRRRLRFRCWHRGIREMDLVLGRFADRHLATLGEAELAELEALMDVPDQEFLGWVTGEFEVPGEHDCGVLRRIIASARGAEAGAAS